MRSSSVFNCALGPKKYVGVAKTTTSIEGILASTGFTSSSTAHSNFSDFWHPVQAMQPLNLFFKPATSITSTEAPASLAPSVNHLTTVFVFPFFRGLPVNTMIFLAIVYLLEEVRLRRHDLLRSEERRVGKECR